MRFVNIRTVLSKILLFIVVLCLCVFFMSVPWFEHSSLKYDLDIFTYIRNIEHENYSNSLSSTDGSFLKFMLSEPLWAYMSIGLDKLLGAEFVFWVFIPFLITVFSALYIYKKTSFFYIFFICHPVFIMFSLNQLRLAFAVSMLYFFHMMFPRRFLYLSLPLVFIHTSVVIFIGLFLLVDMFTRLRFCKDLVFACLLGIGLIFSLVFGPGIGAILSYLGDWRSEIYTGSVWQTSILTSLYSFYFFIVLGAGVMLRERGFTIEQSISIVILSMVFFSFFFVGGYPFRFFSAAFPLLVVSGFNLSILFRFLYYVPLVSIGLYLGFFGLNWVQFFL